MIATSATASSSALPPTAAAAAGPGVPAGTRVPRAQRREQLLDHALELPSEDVFEAIARRAGISRVVVYRSFGNLQGLVLALLRREEAQVRRQLDALVPAEPGDRSPRRCSATRSRGSSRS